MPCKNTERNTALCGDDLQTSNATIIAELTRVRCEFQLRTICAAMNGETK